MDSRDFLTEADARILTDGLLRKAGWDPADKSQVRTEIFTPRASSPRVREDAEVGDAGPETSDTAGRADYVIYSSNGRPLAVVEVKRKGIDPYTARGQTLEYAKSLRAPFIFLTDGELIYFWDYTQGDARPVNAFYSRRDLERLLFVRRESRALATIAVPQDYVRQGEARTVRPYQQEAMRALDQALSLGKRRFLIELPTGTGKTDIICLYLARLLEAQRAERILFLVDREELAVQALGAIQDLLGQYSSYWLKAGMRPQEQQITVCLLQTMTGLYGYFSSGYFDVVIADECHRSIYGAWQIALTHFDAVHIGLTATPAPFIERNTFEFYQCRAGEPDFTYSIRRAIDDGFLVPYRFAEGITQFIAEGTELNEIDYDPAEFERKWTNEDTNRKMMAEFDRLAWLSYAKLAPGQKPGPGKAIVFALTKRHAARLCRYLNELHPEHKGRYAEVIVSDIPDADRLIRDFKKEAQPQVAVSVDMLTTGFDLREVLHLVMCRRVRSPILYQQMRGRGMRTCDRIQKQGFVIYDFFGNHQYFNDSDTDVFTVTGGVWVNGKPRPRPGPVRDLVELGLQDEWLQAVAYVEVGPEGERVDKREYVSRWESAVKSVPEDALISKVRAGMLLSPQEEEELARRLNQPKMYFNEDNLRRAYRQPGSSMIDFIRAALGMATVRSREEEINESFVAWLSARNMKPEQAEYLAMLKSRGVARGKVGVQDLFEPPLSNVNADQVGVRLFGEDGLKEIIEDMNNSMFVRRTA